MTTMQIKALTAQMEPEVKLDLIRRMALILTFLEQH